MDYVKRLLSREKAGKIKGAVGCLAFIPENQTFTSKFADRHGFLQPVLIEKATSGLGLSVPDPSFSVHDVSRLGGKYRQIIAIEASTQHSVEYSLEEWAEYLSSQPDQREVREPPPPTHPSPAHAPKTKPFCDLTLSAQR